MPIYIFDEDAFNKIVKVEGEDYSEFRSKEKYGVCSFDAFFEEWTKKYSRDRKLREFKPEFAIGVEGNKAIYGLQGWNRYLVFNTGEIIFNRLLSTSRYFTEKAEREGFRIF